MTTAENLDRRLRGVITRLHGMHAQMETYAEIATTDIERRKAILCRDRIAGLLEALEEDTGEESA